MESTQRESIPPIIHESWHQYLEPLFQDEKMKIIKYKILVEEKSYPDKVDIFKVFRMPIDQIKVVIIGQDPYPNGEAVGLAFAVKRVTTMPPSLSVMRKEILFEDTGSEGRVSSDIIENIPEWKTLEHWEKQGVFLLNSALTVKRGESSTHMGYWNWFTRKVVEIIATNNPCIWLLWGGKARSFGDFILPRVEFKTNMLEWIETFPKEQLAVSNIVLYAFHPAAEGYNPANKFTGCNHFRICNSILKAKGEESIQW